MFPKRFIVIYVCVDFLAFFRRFYFWVTSTPNIGHELTTPRSRLACSTDRANQVPLSFFFFITGNWDVSVDPWNIFTGLLGISLVLMVLTADFYPSLHLSVALVWLLRSLSFQIHSSFVRWFSVFIPQIESHRSCRLAWGFPKALSKRCRKDTGSGQTACLHHHVPRWDAL